MTTPFLRGLWPQLLIPKGIDLGCLQGTQLSTCSLVRYITNCLLLHTTLHGLTISGDSLNVRMHIFQTNVVRTICPLPRFPSTCCSAPDHFPTPYIRDLFFSEIFKLGMYISRSSECMETVVITPEDLSSTREEWIEDGAFLLKDRVHMTKHGVKAAGDLIRKAVLFWGDHTSIPVANLSNTIPGGIPYSRWARLF